MVHFQKQKKNPSKYVSAAQSKDSGGLKLENVSNSTERSTEGSRFFRLAGAPLRLACIRQSFSIFFLFSHTKNSLLFKIYKL